MTYLFLQNLVDRYNFINPGAVSYLAAPQQLPGTHPWEEGCEPQQVEPTGCSGGLSPMEIVEAEINSSSFDPPQDLQVNSSELRPIPTRSSLTSPHSPHRYSCIGMALSVSSIIGIDGW
jgi:hypothetical protein